MNKAKWWYRIPLIGHWIRNYSWIWYFGFEAVWFSDHHCPYKKVSVFHNAQNELLWCKQCLVGTVFFRLLTLPITLTRDVMLYVLLHNNITRGRITYFLKNIHEKHIDKILRLC